MEKISVVINTYNARQHLRKCLDAVRDFDEIVVCDMESTDDTVAIAREYGCKIVTFPKANHTCCEPARTFAIQSASHKWVLVVDADEIVTPELRSALYEKTTHPDCPAGLFIPRQNMFMNMFVRDFHYDLMDETMTEYIDKMNLYTNNEVERKRDKGYGVGALLWRPCWRFFKNYVLDGSFRMGTRGLIRSLFAAYYQFVLVSKIIEKRYRD